MAAARTLTATRWSTLLGLWLVMLVSLPRYWLQHDMTRLALLAILMIAIAVALVAFWRLMASARLIHEAGPKTKIADGILLKIQCVPPRI